MRLLIKDVMIVTMDSERKFIKQGYILIERDIIIEVKEGKYKGDMRNIRIINGREYCAIPGLINSHTHASMTLLRGYGDGLPLMKWLNEKIWPMENKFKEKHIKVGTELACIEMIRNGITTFSDMYFMESEVMKVVEDFKVRTVLGTSIIGEKWDKELEDAIILKNKVDNTKNNLISIMFAPHSPYTLNYEALEGIAKVAKEYKTPIHIHVSETEEEKNIIKQKYNMTSCELLLKTGIFNNKVAAAHCVHLQDEDINILKQNNVSVIYNPQSNMKLSSGIPRIVDMLKQDINICIGTDGTSSNNNLNMFEEMETAAFLQKLYYKDPTVLNGKEVLEMATINGAKALNLNKVGKIKKGYYADLVLLNINKPNMVPLYDIYSNIVFSANGSEVEYVIINGNVILEKGKFVNIDEEKIIYECNKICKEFI